MARSLSSASAHAPIGREAISRRVKTLLNLSTSWPVDRMLGHKTITASVAGPQIAHNVIGEIGGRFRSYHGVRTNKAHGQIAAARRGMRHTGRQGVSNCRHRDLLKL